MYSKLILKDLVACKVVLAKSVPIRICTAPSTHWCANLLWGLWPIFAINNIIIN